MLCSFCNSAKHESENCDKQASDKTEKMIDKSKICSCCSDDKPDDDNHLPDKKCKSLKKCIGWFSTEHHALFCSKRMEALKFFFLPKIDPNLLLRLFKTMDIDEKYVMVLSSPNGINVVPLEPIKIKRSFEKEDKLPKSKTVILNDSMILVDTNLMKDKKFFDSIFSKTVICFPRILKIRKSKLSAEMILKLLSKYTKEFSLSDSSCNPNLAFSDIIKKAPNLQEIYIYDFETNLIFEKTWVEDLLKYKNGKNFVNLSIKLDILELNVESMVEFIQTKCNKDICINITLDQKLEGNDDDDDYEDIYEAAWEKFEAIKDEFEKYFDDDDMDSDAEDDDYEKGRLNIGFDGGDTDGDGSYSLRKIKKPKRIMPTRAATTRKYL